VCRRVQADLRPDRATFWRRDGEIETLYQVAVVSDANAEVRRITLTNHGDSPRTLEVTSYAEVALNPRRADQAHPAFAKLFMETEYLPATSALLCRRRPRAQDKMPVWALHVLAGANGTSLGDVQFETDRARFLGRGRSVANPAALESTVPLSGTDGPVLDPIFSLRRIIRLAPGTSTALSFTTAAPADRDQALVLANRFTNLAEVDGVFEETASNERAKLAELNLSSRDAAVFQRLAAHILFAGPLLRSRVSVTANKLGQPGLWPQAISGDLPIMLLRIAADAGLELARQVLEAHWYWRSRGLVVDLVVLNDASEDLSRRLEKLIQSGTAAQQTGKPGGIFLRDATALSTEEKTLLEAAARVILRDSDGPLSEQLPHVETMPEMGERIGEKGRLQDAGRSGPSPVGDGSTSQHLLFDNGLGGFSPDGREYVISLRAGQRPPAPWINVLANPDFGCLVTESGGGYTWAGNSQMNRLTPWSNDPVSDPPGEVVYLRDEETGEFWTPTLAPCGGQATTVVRHGQGYTRFTQSSYGLEQDLLILISPTAPVKLFHLRIRNPSDRPRQLTATFYCEWVIGILRDLAPLQVVCAADPDSGTLFATNAWAGAFAGRVAFADVSRRPRSFSTDRAEFLGREGTTAAPAALTRERLSGRAGELGDPCAALMTNLDLAPGGTDEIVFVLGQAESMEEARRLAAAYADPVRAHETLEEVRTLWNRILGAVQVRTPDPAFDLMVNRWLLYQTLACRMWAGRLSTSRAEHSDSATNFRTRWPWFGARRRRPGHRSSGPRRGNSKRATCSTGGTRRPGKASALALATTSTFCRSLRAITSGSPATQQSLMSRCRSFTRRS
jgi:cyclic beta-1,2-glucan synthetase